MQWQRSSFSGDPVQDARAKGNVSSFGFCGSPAAIHQAVSESLPLKQKIFGDLAQHCGPETILATNTSSISIAKIAASAVKSASGARAEEKLASASRCLGM